MKTGEIADFVGGDLIGPPDVDIYSVSSIDAATKGEIAFVEKKTSGIGNASALIVSHDFAADPGIPVIKVPNPKLAFAKVAELLHPPKFRRPEIHPSAIVSETASLGRDIFVGAFVCIGEKTIVGDGSQLRAGAKVGDGVTIGQKCVLHPNVFVEDGCKIGSNVVLHAGVVIGADGFGYVRDADSYVKFPQIGTVVIEDYVEIGANTCVDRGALGETRIGEGSKIDNLVQIAHNVQIGKRVVIAAQTGVSGSTIIEDDCVIGGQVGMGDHARVQTGAVIGSQAGVLPGKIVRPGIWWGTPVQPLDEYKKLNAHIKSIGRMKEDLKSIKLQIRSDKGDVS